MPSNWGLGPKNWFWANWAQKVYQAISQESYFQFSQTRPHFIQNPEGNLINCENIKMNTKPRVCGLKTSFAPIGPKRLTKL